MKNSVSIKTRTIFYCFKDCISTQLLLLSSVLFSRVIISAPFFHGDQRYPHAQFGQAFGLGTTSVLYGAHLFLAMSVFHNECVTDTCWILLGIKISHSVLFSASYKSNVTFCFRILLCFFLIFNNHRGFN